MAAAEDDRIIFLSDVWLDKPATHDRLRAIFDGGCLILLTLQQSVMLPIAPALTGYA